MTERQAAGVGVAGLVLGALLVSLPGLWSLLGLLPLFVAIAVCAP